MIRSCTPLENAISIVPPVPARAAHAGGSGATETAANSTSLCCRGALTAPNEPVRACRRQTVSKLGCTSCRRATSTTLAEGAWLSSTIRSFSTVDHRRRRSRPDRTETLLTFAHLLASQSANYRRQSCRPEGGPHRRVTIQCSLFKIDQHGGARAFGSTCLAGIALRWFNFTSLKAGLTYAISVPSWNTRSRCPKFSEPALLACLACDLFISSRCIYFGKCRKEFRCQRVADSTGETTATRRFVSKLRGGQHLHHHLPQTLRQ